MQHSTKKPTTAQAWRLEQLAAMPCIACEIEGVAQPFRTEIHHLTDKGYRKHSGGHASTLPLCGHHHRGECLDGHTASLMAFHYGPSLARSKRQFTETYGSERALLERVNDKLTTEDV